MVKTRGFIMTAATVLLLGILGLATGGALLWWSIGSDPEKTFTEEGILKILSVESAVYFNDDQTKVGTFFEGAHRDYVHFDSIPRPIIDALVAAEDHDFWTHRGIDIKAIAYAMADNVKAGKLKRGGSTLTQQTAKNLFNRKGRTLTGKFKELVNALKLERHFDKKQILEFYLNQFFVSGNGHGVRIAARYFFDKDLSQLTLVECAFIAGSVKGPNQYNPFIQATPERKDRALKRAKTRVAYVLGQMLRTGKISEAQYKSAMVLPIPFRRGIFRFSLSTNMVLAKHVLESPAVQKALDRYDVQDWMAEGLRIKTTLDARLQRATEASVYRNLSRVDLIVRGYQPIDSSKADVLSHFEPSKLQVGKVLGITSDKQGPQSMEVGFGTLRGTVESKALQTFFSDWNMHETGSRAQPSLKVKTALMEKYFPIGALVLCLTPFPPDGDSIPLGQSLEIVQSPRLQGGGQILKEGRVLANVGGFGNTGYDRVNQARRQFGSTFKPIVYAGALQLGWKPLDPIPNMRQVFRIGNTFYFPKPDHHPEDTVSMVWAGRRSENIASVYLLYHLMDKCDFARFWNEARAVGMAPENFSMQEEFAVFVRDSLGLVLDRGHIAELRFQKASQELSLDLTFDGRIEEGDALKSLPYGLGYRNERNKYAGSRDKEDNLRFKILKRCYLEYFEIARSWDRRMSEGLHVVVGRKKNSSGNGAVGIFDALPDSTWESFMDPNLNLPDDSVLVGGEISVASLQKLSEKLLEKDSDSDGPAYTKENLYNSTDFRALVGLRSMVALSRKLGIKSKLDPVLAYPLGVNVITLGEAVTVYEAFSDGYAYRTQSGANQLLVERITLRDGTVIYEDFLDREKVLTDQARNGLEAILGSVITGGTGRQIGRGLHVRAGENGEVNLRIPAYGKTGTTNDYRNAAFLGFVAAPRGPGKGFDPTVSTTIGVYGGFDDNHPMTRRGFRGTGASVAIPAWLDMAKAVAAVGEYGKNADVLDLEVQATGEPSMFQDEKYVKYIVSKRTGLPTAGSSGPDGTGNYAEDLSDEISDSEQEPSHATDETAVETVKVRED